jgi:O-antigen/teichoic acid export membrane protein
MLRGVIFGVGSMWVARIAAITVGLVVLPVLFRTLGRAELGVWLLFGQAGIFLQLLDFGFKSALTRRIAMATGEHHDFTGEGADLVATGRSLARWLAGGVLIAGLLIGPPLILPLDLGSVSIADAWVAWAFLCLASACTIWSGNWGSVLAGSGHVGWDVALLSATVVLTALAQVALVLSGVGIVGLSAATLAVMLSYAFTVRAVVGWLLPSALAAGRTRRPGLVAELRGPALRLWLTTMGAFCILRTNQFFIAYGVGSEHLPVFQAGWQVVAAMAGVAVTIASASSVFISKLWVAGRLDEIHRLVRIGLHLGLGIFSCGVAVLLVSGDLVFGILLGPGAHPGKALIAILCFTYWLEAHHVIIACASRATDDEVFAPWAIGAGVLNLLLSLALVGPLGVVGVALATALAQLATNNWFVVYHGLGRLRMGLVAHLIQVFLPACGVLLIASGVAWGCRRVLGEGHGLQVLLTTGCVLGAMWAAMAWRLLRHQREHPAA